MFSLSQQEKQILLFVALIVFLGSVGDAGYKNYPELRDILNVMDNPALLPQLDINAATKEELINLPYIGEYTAGQIIEYRERHGSFQHVEEVLSVKGIKKKNFEKFKYFLKV